jgi:hypothetical protein
MAVIQISKIQQRRGQKNLYGIPQLSSGELAWAVDTQELFIGNGSLTEGSPYVGNTKILTEHDNILELANSYTFANDDFSIVHAVPRTLQSKLDEIEVSVIDFGSAIDGSTDCTEAFTRAFEQLFQNTEERYRKVLKVPNGTYLFTGVLRIPSNVTIRGETRDGVVLFVGATGIEFLSANNTPEFSFTSTDRPENIRVENLTIEYTVGQTVLTGVKNTTFTNVKWLSGYFLGQDVSSRVYASQDYILSSITTGGSFYVSGSGVFTTIIQNFTSADPLADPSDYNAVDTIDALADQLNSDTVFLGLFVASRLAESLVIASLPGNDDTADFIASQIEVRIVPAGIADPFSITAISPTAIQASSGVENVVGAVFWRNTLFGTRTNDVTFESCLFEGTALAIKCLQTTAFESSIKFDRCKFYINDTGIYIGGILNLRHNWDFYDCRFEEIAKQCVISTNGTGIQIIRSEIKNCGNGTAGPEYPEYHAFEFTTKYGNTIIDLKSDRHQAMLDLVVPNQLLVKGVSEAINAGNVNLSNDHFSLIQKTPDSAFEPLAVFSLGTRYIEIDYVLTLGSGIYATVRKGRLSIVADDTPDEIAISDNFTYASPNSDDRDLDYIGGRMMTSFEFNAEIVSHSADNDDPTGDSTLSREIPDTILLSYKNPQSIGQAGTISYSLTYGV